MFEFLQRTILPPATTGLILSGGGARAAYQVGVLRAVAQLLPKGAPLPFPVISGTSAGALNAASLATHAQRFAAGVRTLEYVWRNISSDQVYTPASGNILTSASSLMLAAVSGRDQHKNLSLLDPNPLRLLLQSVIRLQKLQRYIDAGLIDAFSITASAYASGESVSFFQGKPGLQEWQGAHRRGLRRQIGYEHLLASASIPFLFPATKIDNNFYGDGVIRQLSPTSTALQLGAKRLMVIGVSGNRRIAASNDAEEHPPTLGRVAGHLMNSAFVDTLENDVENLALSNDTLKRIPARIRRHYGIKAEPIELLEISPSRDLGEMALQHYEELPRAMRRFVKDSTSGVILSLLLFEKEYCSALMELGFNDAMEKEGELTDFLQGR